MRKFIVLFALLLGSLPLSAQDNQITPAPGLFEAEDGELDATQTLKLYMDEYVTDRETLLEAARATGLDIKLVRRPAKQGYINFISDGEYVSEEQYYLYIEEDGIEISAATPAGYFYALQTLRQIVENNPDGKLPACSMLDYPRFEYRGILIDVSRHFRSLDFLKRQIDMMARLKMNRLHLHLTDAAGWRMEIDSYPRLTSYAAWRTPATWKEWWYGDRQYVEEGSEGAYGGYYTKAELRELVAYAADRYITIIPEIEMPGHSDEVLAAYPELRCSHLPERQGELCIGKEATFEMMQAILDEVIKVFPSEYIHIGGDEASKDNWALCEDCQRRMREEGLESVEELQSYMIHRIEEYLNERGRQIIGWDEILQGGLAPNATVMSWRGEEGGIAAAEAEHYVIMSPHGYCYIDAPQDAPPTQPEAIGGYLPLEKVYSYDPAPETMSAKVAYHIKGVQANLWAEFIPTDEHYEMMLWPRAIAIAEVGWSKPQVKDFANFRCRALDIVERMQAEGYNPFDLKNEIGDRPESREPIDHLALGKTVTYNYPSFYYGPQYAAAGDVALVDGLRGTWTYADGRWQGFLGRGGVDVTIDMGEPTVVHSIKADFMQYCGPGVYMPCKVEIWGSLDGENFEPLTVIDHEVRYEDVPSFMNFGWEGETEVRYIRYKAHRSRFSGFLFVDEIVVR
ncbi:MAG: family 20 glycosylhydrolase [Alistipes sp.]|nr:family 20 glycosylhydrolase [Alistipes sp.]